MSPAFATPALPVEKKKVEKIVPLSEKKEVSRFLPPVKPELPIVPPPVSSSKDDGTDPTSFLRKTDKKEVESPKKEENVLDLSILPKGALSIPKPSIPRPPRFGWLKHLFQFPKFSFRRKQSPSKELAKKLGAVPAIAGKTPGKSETDLDALLSKAKTPALMSAAADQEKKSIVPIVKTEMKPDPKPGVEKITVKVKDKPSVNTTEMPKKEAALASILPSITGAAEQAVKKGETQKPGSTEKILSVPAPEKVTAPLKQTALDQSPEKIVEIVYKPMERSKKSGFKDFLGAIKTLGLGREKQALIQNLAMMLDAGLPLVDSLKTLQADTRSRSGKQLVKSIVDAVENGSPLWRAFEDRHCFSPDVIALVRIGEEAGNLAENMGYLAIQQEKDQALRSKVKMAMIYPTIVMVIMLIIVMGLGMFVLPNLIGVLFSLNVPLPLVTRMVIAFTNFFSTQGTVAVPSVLGGLLVIIILAKFTRLKGGAQWVMFHIPGIGRLAREATIARFGVILGGLLQAGVPLVDAIHSLADVTSVVSYRTFYLSLMEHVNMGDSFGKSFVSIRGSSKLLPVTVQQLVTTGERSGSLSKILLKIADIYEKKANDTAQKLPVILEPILLLFIGGLVGTIAFAIIVPIYSIVGNVGG